MIQGCPKSFGISRVLLAGIRGSGCACPFIGTVAALMAVTFAHAASPGGLNVPPGFEVTSFAGDELAHNIHAMTVNARGEVVVAGPGYVKTLLDTNADGIADGSRLFSAFPRSGAHGLFFDGHDLIATGDGTILRLRDADGDGVADGAPEVLRTSMDHGEHGTHGVQRGPDGWFYVMAGNGPQPGAFRVTSTASPVAEARQGALLRFTADFKTCEVVAHGFRNPYDFDFTAAGQIFTFEADGERVHHLPGYGPTRIYDIAVGEHHGWMLNGSRRSWSKPLGFFDRVDSVVDLGRGSPTGVLVYRHRQFPPRYRAGVFAACWSTGVIYFVPFSARGSTVEGEAERFLSPAGNDGFAPVDLAVAPNGDLFVAVGGRGTQGQVLRVRFTGRAAVTTTAGTDLQQVLAADQPLSSWSRARWMPRAKALGAAPFATAAADAGRPEEERVRAIEVLVELFGGVGRDTARSVAATKGDLVLARLAWALARSPATPERDAQLATLTGPGSVAVQRAAWEGLLALPPNLLVTSDWRNGFGSPDRRVRTSAISAARRSGLVPPIESASQPRLVLAKIRAGTGAPEVRAVLEIFRSTRDPELKFEAVRLLQISLGDLRLEGGKDECDTGYAALAFERVAPADREAIARVVLAEFPTGQRELDAEEARLLGMLRTELPAALPTLASFWTPESSPEDDLHFLLVAAQLPGRRPPEFTRRAANALAQLQPKMEARGWLADRQWPLRVGEIFLRLSQADDGLAIALIEAASFGRASHSLFVPLLPPVARLAAARKLLATAQRSTDAEAWTSELIETVGAVLPGAEVVPSWRTKLADPRVRDAVALALAAHADPADGLGLISVLENSGQAMVVEKIATALADFPQPAERREALRAGLRALGRHAGTPAAGLALDRLLARWSGRPPLVGAGGSTQGLFKPWLAWFAAAHPRDAAALADSGGADAAGWLRRFATVVWEKGDAGRGAVIYQQRACAACHDGGRRLGPALTGIAGRFGRDDLLLNIVDPNLSISPTYRAQEVTLKDGTVYRGVPVYQSSAALMLEVGPGATVRVRGDQIASSVPALRSPMPEGLLNGITNAELADFYAYLATLQAEKPAR